MLTPEGARVQPDWLNAFLRGPITIRPWLSVRMPTFGLDDVNVNGVIRYFGAVSNTVGPFQTHQVMTANTGDAGGKALFDALQCQSCHVLGRDSRKTSRCRVWRRIFEWRGNGCSPSGSSSG